MKKEILNEPEIEDLEEIIYEACSNECEVSLEYGSNIEECIRICVKEHYSDKED